MEKILGLDLGTNSIGWAIRTIDPSIENQITDKGVLTFDKGVAEDKSGEHPMVQKRTEARGKRRNYQAEKYRKWELLECLIENKMCPLTIEELNEWRHYKKSIGRKYPQSPTFINWLRFDFDGDGKPDFERFRLSKQESYYVFRKLIIDESKTAIFKQEPHIVGRILYQLVQRRGYNDGDTINEAEKDELSKTIMKGGGDSGAAGANEIQPYIAKYKTLGAALYQIQKEQNVRIRKRYNLRSDFKKEIEEICRVQGLEHLQKTFCSAIIWQRPLRSQKGLVGVCTFEQNKSRCPISHPLYEEYRTWVFINNLKIKPIYEKDIPINKISKEECLQNIVYPQFFKAAPDFKLSSIKKALEKEGFQITAKFYDDTKVISLSFLYKMQQIFGEDWATITGWNDLLIGNKKQVKYNLEDLWHIHFAKKDNKETGETAFEYIKRFAREKLQLQEDKIEPFSKIKLQQGYATLSVNAIKKILPYLQKAYIYSEAIYLANLPKVMGVRYKYEDVDAYASIVKEVLKQDKEERIETEIYNSLITQYFENKQQFEADKIALIEQQIIESFGANTWNRISVEKQSVIETVITNAINSFLAQPKQKVELHYKPYGRLHDKIFNRFADDYGLPFENRKHLWHPSEQDIYAPAPEKNGKLVLGSPEPISKGFKNPMALKTMHHLKKLINYLIEVGKIDTNTRIVVEIARELNDANKRKAIERWQREREKQNEEYRKTIDEINSNCKTNFARNDKDLIDKIRLWNEQGRTCLYTGKTINMCDVFNGTKYNIEHTIPASMSFDNELKNLTLANKTYNQQIKIKKLPTECPNYCESVDINGTTYPSILATMQNIFGKMTETKKKVKGKEITTQSFEKIVRLEKELDEWYSKTSDDKEIKDNIIIRRHLIKMELDYWRYKLQTFTTTEYKAGWRNSQLRDTQTITKYALPYLKTVFDKVEVQKGEITAQFRKIYGVQNKQDKKERTKHSHHAIDAAVLTLIPPAATRDKILERYNQAKDNHQGYHESPRQWQGFKNSFITNIEDEVLINFQAQHRTLTPTYKNVRKRGKQQFITDDNGNKLPLKAQGDSIRGQLHKESFFGAINNKGNLNLVERYPVAAFTSINDCKHIVDDAVREIVKNELEKRMANGLSFDKAKLKPIPFPNGKAIIKKVRCKVLAGAGYLRFEKAEKIRSHNFINPKHDYKHHIYAQNNEMTYLLFFENTIENNTYRAFSIIGLFELSQLKLTNDKDLLFEQYYSQINIKKGKSDLVLTNPTIIKIGTKCIFYKESIDELKELNYKNDLIKRTFVVYKFNTETTTHFIYLKNHLEARADKDIKEKEYRNIDFENYQSRLQFTADKFQCAIEHKHFTLTLDGTINWKI